MNNIAIGVGLGLFYRGAPDPEECVETIRRYVDAGCTKFVLRPVGPLSQRIEQLERYSRDVISEFGSPSVV